MLDFNSNIKSNNFLHEIIFAKVSSMKSNRNRHSPQRSYQLMKSICMSMMTGLLIIIYQPACGAEQNTTYLPLHVIAPQVDESFLAQVDATMEATLAATELTMIDRAAAQAMVGQKQWPPTG